MKRHSKKREQNNMSVEFADEFVEVENSYLATEIAGGKIGRKINETQESVSGSENLTL